MGSADGPAASVHYVWPKAPKSICFYLPQFHPIPENDEWWGRGFTEWTNVAAARPHFHGHHQPDLPGDLGFYDLRVPDTRQAQADLAAEFRVFGFCYWHYWFSGKQLLERPLADVLSSGVPDFPFSLCWANEPWSRRWLGEEKDVLQAQTYSAEDDTAHAGHLAGIFQDPRYIRIDGRPLFLVYRPTFLPDAARFLDAVTLACAEVGLPRPFFVGVDAHAPGTDMRALGFDRTLTFQPQLGALPGPTRETWDPRRLLKNLRAGVVSGSLRVYPSAWARDRMRRFSERPEAIPSVVVSWDNTPRRGRRAIVLKDTTPQEFQEAVENAVRTTPVLPDDERLVFINAWNEWAEGNHLEPGQRLGRAFLEAHAAALARTESRRNGTNP